MVQQSRLPASIIKCKTDLPMLAQYVNEAQQRLIYAMGETGAYGGWWKVVFHVCRSNPYITLPREFARAINMEVCRFPIAIQNQFYELLEAGIGTQDFHRCGNWCGALAGYDRGNFPSLVDLTDSNQYLQVVLTDQRDVGARVLIGPASDQNGNSIYSQDGNNSVDGFYLTLAATPATSPMIVTKFTGLQKDATYGDVLLYQLDATTGAQVLLSRYAPDEIAPAYRRYYINNLPCGCHHVTPTSPCITGLRPGPLVQVTAMVKLEFIPANRATDWLIIGNIPALIEEVQALRFGVQDLPTSMGLAQAHHAMAIKLLNQEIGHYMGTQKIAVNFAPFGTANLRRPMSAVRTG